jgi:hypothetical protein
VLVEAALGLGRCDYAVFVEQPPRHTAVSSKVENGPIESPSRAFRPERRPDARVPSAL